MNSMDSLSPKDIVRELDKYIIGQDAAKKAVAIALRNRYRRSKLTKEMRDEITKRNSNSFFSCILTYNIFI